MTHAEDTQVRSNFSLWMQAVRPFAFPASVVPILFGAIFTITYSESDVHWILLPLIIVAGILIHSGTNLVGEYFDLKKGVDRKETFGSSRILVDELLPAKKVLNAGILTFAISFALGMIMVFYPAEPNYNLLIIGLIGLAGGFFYTGTPMAYKYVALGDVFVFALMGPLMVLGTFTALTGTVNWDLVLLSLPIGFLVASILNANNIRDIIHDKKANINTMATLMGTKSSKAEYYFLVIGAYLAVVAFVAFGLLKPWALIVALALPAAIANIKMIANSDEDKPEQIAISDIKSAQHHLLFGVLYSIGLLLTILL